MIIKNLFVGLKYSNYLVLKCYKLLLDFELIKKNIGFIFMTIIFICLLIIFFIYIIKGRSKIVYYIQVILKNKNVYINNRKSMQKNNIKKNFKINPIKNKKTNNLRNNLIKKNKMTKKKVLIKNKNKNKNKNKKSNPPLKKSKK